MHLLCTPATSVSWTSSSCRNKWWVNVSRFLLLYSSQTVELTHDYCNMHASSYDCGLTLHTGTPFTAGPSGSFCDCNLVLHPGPFCMCNLVHHPVILSLWVGKVHADHLFAYRYDKRLRVLIGTRRGFARQQRGWVKSISTRSEFPREVVIHRDLDSVKNACGH